ncbi:MAG TPA: hypothetical protein VMH31_03490 [Methylomirabilota bacterium]|nr:hypothetical protein [Methylomirabilota bacterium]
MRLRPLTVIAVMVCVLLASCSSGPSVPEGDQHFLDAKNNLKSSDFKAALTNLQATLKSTTNPAVKQEAGVLRVVLVTGLAGANKEMGEAYQIGAKQPAAAGHTAGFYKTRSDYYNTAHAQLMDAMQTVMDQRQLLSDKPMVIEVVYPGFTGTNPGINNIRSGQFVGDAERVQAELQADRDALALVLAGVAGAKDNLNKGKEIYAAGKVEIDPRVYLLALNESFLKTGEMFGYRALNEPDHLTTVNQVVMGNLEVVKKMLVAKPDKDLDAQVKKQMDQMAGKPEKKGK